MPYQPEWESIYEQEKSLLAQIFHLAALDIQHVGSTSIEGLSAKPVIDIAVQVERLPIPDYIIDQLIKQHYKERVDRLGSSQVVYVKGPEENETHFLHIIPSFNPDWAHKLRFRDYLRAHAEALQVYDCLKRELAQRYQNDRGAYTKGKHAFIQRILSIAP